MSFMSVNVIGSDSLLTEDDVGERSCVSSLAHASGWESARRDHIRPQNQGHCQDGGREGWREGETETEQMERGRCAVFIQPYLFW